MPRPHGGNPARLTPDEEGGDVDQFIEEFHSNFASRDSFTSTPFQSESQSDSHDRLLAQNYPSPLFWASPHAPPRSSTSSMAHMNPHPSAPTVASSRTPSLSNGSTFSNNTSLRTSDVRVSPQLLEEGPDGVLQLPNGSLQYPCLFPFLRCTDTLTSASDWQTHVLAHFRLHTPPTTAKCMLCPMEQFQASNGWTAWTALLDHVAEHVEAGMDVTKGRVDKELVRWMFGYKIVDDQTYKQLLAGADVGAGSIFVRTAGRSARFDVRRQRDVDRERRRIGGDRERRERITGTEVAV